MREFLAILIAFSIMPILTKKKISLGPVMIITGLILALIAGISFENILNSFTKVFTSMSSFQTILVVFVVGILGVLLKHYNILNNIVESLQVLIPSKKALIAILPAVLGLLAVPGGAYLSAPFAESLGEDLNMPMPKRAAVNLVFRHSIMYLLPFSTSVIFVASSVPGINIYSFIMLNAGFIFILMAAGYFLYIHPCVPQRKTSEVKISKGKAVLNLIKDFSPIYMIVVLNVALNLPIYVSAALSIVITFFICDKKDFIKTAISGINFGTVFMLVGVYFIQNIIANLNEVMLTFQNLFSNSEGIVVLLVIVVASLIFGLATGLSYVPMGILFPIIGSLSLPSEVLLIYVFFIFCWGFIGYFYSPLHLCQLLTVKSMCINGQGPVYKEHYKLLPFLVIGSFALFYLYQLLLV